MSEYGAQECGLAVRQIKIAKAHPLPVVPWQEYTSAMAIATIQATGIRVALNREELRAIASANGWLLTESHRESDWFLHDRSREGWARHEVTVFYDEGRRPVGGTAVDYSAEGEHSGFHIAGDELTAALKRAF